jgi:cysteine synthase
MSMSAPQAKRVVVLSVATAGTMTTVRDLAKGDAPSIRTIVGVVVAGVLLAGMAEVAPSVAGGLALLLLTAATFVVGGEAWTALSRAVN